jgi:DNA-binding NtrC family response regulator
VNSAPPHPRLLVADDEPINRRLLRALFSSEGFEVVLADGGQEAIAEAKAKDPAVVVLDLRMPDMDGLEVLAQLREKTPRVPVIVITAHGDIPSAIEATRLGAFDFLLRPLPNDKLVLSVKRALERSQLEAELHLLRKEAQGGGGLLRLRGLGAAMTQVVGKIRSVAASPLTVLLQGETGTGKEVVARAVHMESDRRDKPFVALDCGAIPESLLESELFGHEKGAFTGAARKKDGQFQLAQGGTLFLDELSNFNLGTQAKLLRVLQERKVLPLGASQPVPVDVRVIAATNQTLEALVQGGLFRQDLYYRLAEFVIALPPLRERPEDVLILARRFLEEASLELHRPASTLSEPVARLLEAHSWPGNVRELRNVIRQAALSSTGVSIEPADVEHLLGKRSTLSTEAVPVSLGSSLKEIGAAATAAAERQAIIEALRLARGNKAEAARILKTDYKTLYLKIRRYELLRPG